MKTHHKPLRLAAILLVVSAGCSFSTSSKSISDSISGSSGSISDSSTSSSPSDGKATSEPETLYREDVRNLTTAWVQRGGDLPSFQRDLGALARRHGIGDWESAPATWSGIEDGLHAANASRAQRTALEGALRADRPPGAPGDVAGEAA